jgi:hypothetical protein
MDHATFPQLATGMDERFELTGFSGGPKEKHLGWCARIARTEQPGAKDARRIDRNRVPGRNHVDEIGKSPVLEGA